MRFPFDECIDTFQRDLLAALSRSGDEIAAMATAETNLAGRCQVDGVSFDILPWHKFVCLSFRIGTDERAQDRYRYSPADWKYYEFVSEPFDATRDLVATLYNSPPNAMTSAEAVHLIYTAAAEALLAGSVSSALQDSGINAPEVVDSANESNFEYMVIDEDRVLRANYCDVLLANRITKRLLDE